MWPNAFNLIYEVGCTHLFDENRNIMEDEQ
jgi:hypothetical protein